MNSFLALATYLQPTGYGASSGSGSGSAGPHTVAMDWFVLINLAFLMFMLGFFACWAWLIWRRTTKPPPHVQLIMELEEEEAARQEERLSAESATPTGEPERAPWEREQDWWKK